MNDPDPRIPLALDNLPAAPLPPGFVRKTMARLPARRPRFRLEFVDVAVPAFLTMFLFMAGSTGIWLVNQIDPVKLAQLQIQLEWLWLNLPALPAWNVLALGTFGLACIFLILMGIAASVARPAPFSRTA